MSTVAARKIDLDFLTSRKEIYLLDRLQTITADPPSIGLTFHKIQVPNVWVFSQPDAGTLDSIPP
jgi:hypothetical protein